MLLWMALLRKLPRQVRQFHEFHRDGLTGPECQGKTLAVVGVGNIGHEVCAIGRALGMNVLGVDRDPRHADVDYATIEQALAQADVIVCAMDLNDSNRGYFDAAKWRAREARRHVRQHLPRRDQPVDGAGRGARRRPARRRRARRVRPRTRARRRPPHRRHDPPTPRRSPPWSLPGATTSSARRTTRSTRPRPSTARACTRSSRSTRFSPRANSSGRRAHLAPGQ